MGSSLWSGVSVGALSTSSVTLGGVVRRSVWSMAVLPCDSEWIVNEAVGGDSMVCVLLLLTMETEYAGAVSNWSIGWA